MNCTDKLVDSVLSFKKRPLPGEVIERTKMFILDNIGCALGGYATKLGKQIVNMAKEFHGLGDATIIGGGAKVSTPFALWANSSLANLLDMDDVYAGTAHQANCLVPTALAVGEVNRSSGLQVIEAIVCGFEVGSRIMMYSWPSPLKSRQYFPSTWQVFDAVAVTGILLGFDKRELYNAFGLAGTVAPLPIDMKKFVERPMGFAKNVFGWTTLTGHFWALMAQRGVEGATRIFDGEAGFWKIMGSDSRNYDSLLQDFGGKYNILETKYKPYPLCTWGHTSLDALQNILSTYEIDKESIQSIYVKTIARAVDFLSSPKMETILDAQFSLPYSIAMLVLGKEPGPEWMTEDNIFYNAEAKSIANKVKMEVDPYAEKIFNEEKGQAIPSEVTVKMSDGNVYKESVKYSKGTPKNPFTDKEIVEKYTLLAKSNLAKKKLENIQEIILNLEMLDDISELTNQFTAK